MYLRYEFKLGLVCISIALLRHNHNKQLNTKNAKLLQLANHLQVKLTEKTQDGGVRTTTSISLIQVITVTFYLLVSK